tara:strand:+ start:73 stop:1731 length:1659 start_codon:yes stop_codon:yes gene_type:complete
MQDSKHYYKYFFPHEELCRLLGRQWRGKNLLEYRELALETHDGYYNRWQSVGDAAELRALLLAKRVSKIHIGAIFDAQPVMKKKLKLQPTLREFVVDIDIDDNTNFGVDANDIESCDNAWPLVAFGMVVVEHVLKKHFGFINTLTVYSGRRGAHLTVYDARACALTDEERSALVDYMQPSGNGNTPKYGNVMSIFGDMWDSHVLPFWLGYCLETRENGGAGFLEGPTDKDDFMNILGNEYTKDMVNILAMTGKRAWDTLWQHAQKSDLKFGNSYLQNKLKHTVLSYVWPRLDVNVSKAQNHLAKSVFSIHPKTGRICIPILAQGRDPFKFNPRKCALAGALASGDKKEVRKFRECVAAFGRFVDKLEVSPSEKWTRAIMHPDTLHYSLISKKRHRGQPASGYYATNRICYLLQRVFVAASSITNPKKVQISWYTTILTTRATQSVTVVQAGYCPPFRANENKTFPLEDFKSSIAVAAHSPNTEILCGSSFLCVLLQERIQDEKVAIEKLKEMLPDMKQRQHLGDVHVDWGDAMKSILTTHVEPIWKVDKIVF